MVNQQQGLRLTELEGIRVFSENGWCETGGEYGDNGGTTFYDRKRFMEKYGLQVEDHLGSLRIKDNEKREDLQLEEIARRLSDGWSAQMGIIAQDLTKPGIWEERHKKSLMGFGPGQLIRELSYANHAVTIAGCSTDETGRITGMWINDSGGWSLGSNRIFIDADKWKQMLGTTYGISLTYARKAENWEG